MPKEKIPAGTHPNSLANLRSAWTSDTARDAQKLGAAKRSANAKARKELAMSMSEWKSYRTEVLDKEDMSSVDVLKILMHKALMEDDFDTAADLAKTLAEFEKPKLARIESKVEEVGVSEITDEELLLRLKAAAGN